MDEGGAMLWGRVTYEMMESYWPAVARGDEEAPPAMREWAVKLEAKPKYVVSSTRKNFPWTNSHHIAGDLRTSCEPSYPCALLCIRGLRAPRYRR
jgi:dihydrofolate reductase